MTLDSGIRLLFHLGLAEAHAYAAVLRDNAMPAASNAERSFSTVEILASRPVSNRFTELAPTFAARARSIVLQSRAARAIRH